MTRNKNGGNSALIIAIVQLLVHIRLIMFIEVVLVRMCSFDPRRHGPHWNYKHTYYMVVFSLRICHQRTLRIAQIAFPSPKGTTAIRLYVVDFGPFLAPWQACDLAVR